MNNTIRFLILLFAVMFFWIANTDAFADTNTMRCYSNGSGLLKCIKPDGTIVTIYQM